ncbi:hypothetical protein BF49_3603 [Bradyrhizobium sp.]|uniref:hypothetical protein n=1 Tax=Bradyrhizobium sp. TaxID=376 RepID=UPI0007C19F5B|nr:hypothetical protein [Bradyrhizobium sp.]CUT12523.1 hypothetical protein BF49_3603 [Bradyrhizobium sp.]
MLDMKYDLSGLKHISNALHAAGDKMPLVLNRAINHTGDKALTQMRSVLVGQTGLKRRTLVRAVKSTKAFGAGAYVIRSKGGNIRVKFFAARETRKGVSAAPWNSRRIYPGTFMKGGRFPNRVALKLGGAVLKRVGKSRHPLETIRSGLFIPEEMVKGQSEAAFFAVIDRDLPGRIAHELYRVLN